MLLTFSQALTDSDLNVQYLPRTPTALLGLGFNKKHLWGYGNPCVSVLITSESGTQILVLNRLNQISWD